jgi:hypothetical protein
MATTTDQKANNTFTNVYARTGQPAAVVMPVQNAYADWPTLTTMYPVKVHTRTKTLRAEQLVPLQVDGMTFNEVVLRTPVSSRGKRGTAAMVLWRPSELDYGLNADMSQKPQVFVFPTARERDDYQMTVSTYYPELGIRSYDLPAPVVINTHTLPYSGTIPNDTLMVPYGTAQVLNYPSMKELMFDPEDPTTYDYPQRRRSKKSKRGSK